MKHQTSLRDILNIEMALNLWELVLLQRTWYSRKTRNRRNVQKPTYPCNTNDFVAYALKGLLYEVEFDVLQNILAQNMVF